MSVKDDFLTFAKMIGGLVTILTAVAFFAEPYFEDFIENFIEQYDEKKREEFDEIYKYIDTDFDHNKEQRNKIINEIKHYHSDCILKIE